MKNQLGTILFMGRKGCSYSLKIKNLLKKKAKKFYFFQSNKFGEKIDNKFLKIDFDYIFCFRSFYILKKSILKNVKKHSINFHPGPPEYPGVGCVNYAVYENSKFYGCTAHIINEKIDNGKIIDIKKFKISKEDNISKILNKTYKTMLRQAIFIIKNLEKDSNFVKKQIKLNKKNKWSNKVKKLKALNKFYQINRTIKKKDLLNKIRATYTPKFKPYIKLYGKKFILE